MQTAEAPAESSCPACECRVFQFLESSIGKKIMVALAGLFLSFFLVTHLAGNMFLYGGEKAFDGYAGLLERNPLIPVAEVGLLVLFLIHIALAVRARLINNAARPVAYEAAAGKGARTAGSRTIAVSGALILLFLIVHLKAFRFIPHETRENDLFSVVAGSLRDPMTAGFYVLAMIGLGLHLSHGVQSALQTLGLNHPRYTPTLKKLGLAFALLIALGFGSIPVYFAFLGRSPNGVQGSGTPSPIGSVGGAQ